MFDDMVFILITIYASLPTLHFKKKHNFIKPAKKALQNNFTLKSLVAQLEYNFPVH